MPERPAFTPTTSVNSIKPYAKWVNDSRKNDRDDIDKDARKMQDIMPRNNIPPDVPYNSIASNGYGQDLTGAITMPIPGSP